MEDVPQMPPVPAAGHPVSGELIYAAERARKLREHLSDNTPPAAKVERGDDMRRVFDIMASATNFQGQQQLQQIAQQQAAMGAQLQQISQQQAAMGAALGARLDNGRRRGFNMRALTSEARALQPLVREAQQAEGGAAPGAAPPAGTFPATLQELHALSNGQLNALAEFYGEPFAGSTVVQRRLAFLNFVTM